MEFWLAISPSKVLHKCQVKLVWGDQGPHSTKQSRLGLTNSLKSHFSARTLVPTTQGLQSTFFSAGAKGECIRIYKLEGSGTCSSGEF